MSTNTVWGNYYSKNYLPWDTKAPSSHLLYYLTKCTSRLTSRKGDENFFIPGCDNSNGEDEARAQARLLHVCPDCQHMKPSPGLQTNCLELACGTGASCVYMAKVFTQGKSIGVDFITEAVSSSRDLASLEEVLDNCAFLQADVFSLSRLGKMWNVGAAWTLSKQQQQAVGAPNKSAENQEHHPTAEVHALREDIQDESRRAMMMEATPELQASIVAHTATTHTTSSSMEVSPCGADDSFEREKMFDFIYDCQAFHALRHVDETAYLQLLHSSLKPGGLLMLLTGNANEAECGPSVLTQQDLLNAFPDSKWDWIFLVQSRFDATPAYLSPGRDRLPLAWWGLVKRRK